MFASPFLSSPERRKGGAPCSGPSAARSHRLKPMSLIVADFPVFLTKYASFSANLDWLLTLLGYTLAAAGALLLLWSLFHDRPKGRRRCPRCWYDMRGVPSLLCPECGR